jgi:hypothetical protein
MKITITKTRIKYLNENLRTGYGKQELWEAVNKLERCSYSYIQSVINSEGRMPNGVTPLIRCIFEQAEIIVAKRIKEAKGGDNN